MDGDRTIRRFRVRRAAVALLLALVPVIALSFCVGGPGYYSAKYAPAGHVRDGDGGSGRPLARPGPIEPETQTEPHTCGFHAMSSLYRAYGLDPEARQLRFRLGTDKPANLLAPESRGTIHPDLLRVLGQDGFEAELVFVKEKDALERTRAHLRGGHCALALIRTEESGALHWVVLGSAAADHVAVCDSLAELPYERALAPYLSERVVNLLLVQPG